ncbi:MAG: apolipoprotein N-acyltransferase [Terriglobales bacterium]
MRIIDKSAWLLVVLSGGLQVLIFPTPDLYWLCWVAITPLLVAVLRARTPELEISGALGRQSLLPATAGQAFLLGWLAGAITYAGSCYWVMYTMHVYGGLNTPVALGVQVLFCLWVGAQTGLFALLLALVAGKEAKSRSGITRTLIAAPFLWVAVELIRSRIIGLPWDLLGNAQVNNIPLTRLATVTGVYGLSFEIMVVNTAFAAAILTRQRRKALLGAAVFAAAALQLSVFVQPPPVPASYSATLVQPNLSLDENWTSQRFRQTLAAMQALSLAPAAGRPATDLAVDLIVWPESPGPFWANEPAFRTAASQLAIQSRAYLIAGALAVDEASVKAGQVDPEPLLNTAVLITPDGHWVASYDKIHLVPFGEYVPYRSVLGFAHQLTREVGNFVPGWRRTVFDMGSYKMGPFICYESIFPNEIRQFALQGAQVFVNISDDAWYGRTGAPGQHLNMARMRAIENDRWLLLGTNNGITAAVDPFGRIVEQAPRNVFTALNTHFGIVTTTTFYTRHGDWFAWLCVIITVFSTQYSVLNSWLQRRPKTGN